MNILKIKIKKFFFVSILVLSFSVTAKCQSSAYSIPLDHVMSNNELLQAVKPGVKGLENFYAAREKGKTNQALKILADYLKQKSADRFYFSWKNFNERFRRYSKEYPSEKNTHLESAEKQMTTFPSLTKWELPFNNLKGKKVTTYELRHLARQYYIFDIGMSYYYSNEDTSYLNYFMGQVKSLNAAFEKKEVGKDVFEYFHCGNRVVHWMLVNNAFLASPKYTRHDQLTLIKTFLYHGAVLAKITRKYNYGNHHTKGLVGLFLISTLYPEFVNSAQWQQQAVNGITMHMEREVNEDGFQFERSVHYHIGDIENYFLVYQLAKINNVKLPGLFLSRLRGMFEALVKMAQPNKTLPVLQDDTDRPLAEFNTIDEAMTVGTILFKDKTFRYYSDDKIPASLYWLIKLKDFNSISKLKGEGPKFGSIALTNTGYYVMRNGWKKNDQYMIISAGLSKQKPDHQHADMLGIVAYSHCNEIIPNYQVNYPQPDFSFFKNSWVNNVVLVDSIPQGRKWIPNPGGDGFGKWKSLPVPKVLAWKISNDIDYFAGTNNGYNDLFVNYTREVFFIKEGFWIVKDNFSAKGNHSFQQIWQGHFEVFYNNMRARTVFQDGSGLEIVQLGKPISKTYLPSFRSKGSVMFYEEGANDFSFVTLLYPFDGFDGRILKSANIDSLGFKGWTVCKNRQINKRLFGGLNTDAEYAVYDKDKMLLINCKNIDVNGKELFFDKPVSLFLNNSNKKLRIFLLNHQSINLKSNFSANVFVNGVMNRTNQNSKFTAKPDEETEIIWKN